MIYRANRPICRSERIQQGFLVLAVKANTYTVHITKRQRKILCDNRRVYNIVQAVIGHR